MVFVPPSGTYSYVLSGMRCENEFMSLFDYSKYKKKERERRNSWFTNLSFLIA